MLLEGWEKTAKSGDLYIFTTHPLYYQNRNKMSQYAVEEYPQRNVYQMMTKHGDFQNQINNHLATHSISMYLNRFFLFNTVPKTKKQAFLPNLLTKGNWKIK